MIEIYTEKSYYSEFSTTNLVPIEHGPLVVLFSLLLEGNNDESDEDVDHEEGHNDKIHDNVDTQSWISILYWSPVLFTSVHHVGHDIGPTLQRTGSGDGSLQLRRGGGHPAKNRFRRRLLTIKQQF